MVDSVADQLTRDMDCEALLGCFYGHTGLDESCFRALGSSNRPLTVDDVAAAVGHDRSTVYRSVQRLLATGVVEKEQVNYDDGGYCHVYSVVDSGAVSRDMYRTLNDWYTEFDGAIDDFAIPDTGPDSPPVRD
ncbi:helix-turn-helix domain-containing protein [Halorubrum ejinorense]|uniref:Helix-turn-helix domain-containing protein n=1 Tax=Halorubrum ejinorense TaxID=425309 RepID=A0AAV3SP85_9EURY